MPHPHTLAGRKRISTLILALTAAFMGSGGMPLEECLPPPAFTELYAQIDQVWNSGDFDCLVVQHEIFPNAEEGTVRIITDFANACGEDVWVNATGWRFYIDETFVEEVLVADGELVTLGLDMWEPRIAERQDELEFGVLTDSERDEFEDVQHSDYAPLVRVDYSYSGTPYEGNCRENEDSGCAASSSAPTSPTNGPLSWVMLGLGLVWVGRRSGRGGRV